MSYWPYKGDAILRHETSTSFIILCFGSIQRSVRIKKKSLFPFFHDSILPVCLLKWSEWGRKMYRHLGSHWNCLRALNTKAFSSYFGHFYDLVSLNEAWKCCGGSLWFRRAFLHTEKLPFANTEELARCEGHWAISLYEDNPTTHLDE